MRWPISIAAAVLAGTACFYSRVLQHPDHRPDFNDSLPWISISGFVVVLSLFIHFWRPRTRWLVAQLTFLCLSGAALRIAAILASPNPQIDVFTALRDAPTYLLHGENPYTSAYVHPYDAPPLDYDRYPFYPPLPFLVCLPFCAIGIDVRFANVLCDLIAAWILFQAGRGRGDALTGAFAAGAYLHFPRAAFVISEAWYEPMLAALIGSGLYLIEARKKLGFLLLGLALTGKQYGPVLFGPIVMALRGQRLSLLAGIALAAGVIVVPFMLWDAQAFLDVVLNAHLQRPSRADAVTVQNLLRSEWDVGLPRIVWWALGVAIVVLVSLRAPPRPLHSAMWAGTALLAFVLLHTQSFFNYFYLCAYLLLLGVVSSGERAICQPASQDHRGPRESI
jgi:hypothetical protein